jgi:NAD(P)-dependent dehydrogenase (short-subunit alcohol dehydrogenase family)
MTFRGNRDAAGRRSGGRVPSRVATAARGPRSTHGGVSGRGVVVTGGASGIGRAIALAFAAAGARVTILDREAKNGARTLVELQRYDVSARFVRVNLQREREILAAAREIFRGGNGPSIVVNNAATTGPIVSFTKTKRADLDRVFRTNVFGPYIFSQIAARHMIASGRPGAIVNIHAIQTVLPIPGHTAYIASKGALDGLTLAMAVDLAPHGIRVNGVQVGSVMTESFHDAMAKRLALQGRAAPSGKAMDRLLDARAATLLGRMGRPEEIARLVLFLAGDESSFITGSIIRADGGRSISRKTETLR